MEPGTARLIAELPTDEYTRRGTPNRWSVRDVVVHIAAWRRQAAAQLEHADSTAREELDIQTFNERTFQEHQDLSWTAIKRIAESPFLALRKQASQLSDKQLRQSADLSGKNWSPWQLIKVDGFHHPMGHMATLYRRLGYDASAESIEAALARNLGSVARDR